MIAEDETYVIALKTHACANGETVEVHLVGITSQRETDLSPRRYFNKNESSPEGALRALLQTALPESAP